MMCIFLDNYKIPILIAIRVYDATEIDLMPIFWSDGVIKRKVGLCKNRKRGRQRTPWCILYRSVVVQKAGIDV